MPWFSRVFIAVSRNPPHSEHPVENSQGESVALREPVEDGLRIVDSFLSKINRSISVLRHALRFHTADQWSGELVLFICLMFTVFPLFLFRGVHPIHEINR